MKSLMCKTMFIISLFSLVVIAGERPWEKWRIGDAWDLQVNVYPPQFFGDQKEEEIAKIPPRKPCRYSARVEIKGEQSLNGQEFWMVDLWSPEPKECIIPRDGLYPPVQHFDLTDRYRFWISKRNGGLLKVQIFVQESLRKTFITNLEDDLEYPSFYMYEDPTSSDSLMNKFYWPRWLVPFEKLSEIKSEAPMFVKKENQGPLMKIQFSWALQGYQDSSLFLQLSEEFRQNDSEIRMAFIQSKKSKERKWWEIRELWKRDALWWSEYETHDKYSRLVVKAQLIKESLVPRNDKGKAKPETPDTETHRLQP